MHIIKITIFFLILNRQNERSSALSSLNVNKVSRFFSHHFILKIRKGRLREFLREHRVKEPKQTLYFREIVKKLKYGTEKGR